MKLIVFSSPDRSIAEAKEVTQMFEEGLKYFHIRKTNFSRDELISYLNAIPSKYHSKIVIHSQHALKKAFKLGGLHINRTQRKKKFKSKFKFWLFKKVNSRLYFTRTHSKLSSLTDDTLVYKYVFLSPIYDSISKIGHAGNFGNRSIEKYVKLSKSPVIALGGVDVDKFQECKELGFEGVAVLGYIWNNDIMSPIEAFRKAKETLKNLD